LRMSISRTDADFVVLETQQYPVSSHVLHLVPHDGLLDLDLA